MYEFFMYLLGFLRGKAAGTRHVVIDSGITCTDDGSGNITITQDEEG